MKYQFLLFVCISISSIANAQLKGKAGCPPITVDVMDGSVNGIYPKSSIVEIKGILPCFTSVVDTDSIAKCAGVFYADRDIHFYTARKYFEIGEKFNGKLSPALIGVSRNKLFSLLGHPKLKDTGWDAFQMGYGTLILYYNTAGKINKIQISSKKTDDIKLCE